jgi:hypothetical protein
MTSNKMRKPFVAEDKYQRQIVLLSFFPPLLFCIFFSVFVFVMDSEMGKVILSNSPAVIARQVNQWTHLIVSCLFVIYILSLAWSFVVSRNIVGAFGRIIRELDDVIDGKSKKTIGARTEDKLANELLKRINVLIKHYVETKK